jgi:hypothetical protein
MAPIRRYFPATSLRSHFAPEMLLASPPHALRIVFADETVPSCDTVSTEPGSPAFRGQRSEDSPMDFEDEELIPKPPGEAGRHGNGERQGYNLKDALQWDAALYDEVMVCYSFPGKSGNLTSSLSEVFQGIGHPAPECPETAL